MCDPVTIGVTMTAISTVAQGYAAKQQGKYQQGVANYNARVAENEAVQTRNIGTEREMEHRQQVAQLVSKQRAQIGASGLSLAGGSAAGLLEDTQLQGEVDALRIRSNFERQAQSLETQATLERSQGKAAKAAGNAAFTGSLLSAVGGMASSGVADKWLTSSSAANVRGQASPLFNNTAYVKRY